MSRYESGTSSPSVDTLDRLRAAAGARLELPDVVLADVHFHVFTIGEAVKALPGKLTAQRPDVPWSDIATMRDLAGHHCYKLDTVIVRATIGEPLERLRAACEAMLAEDLT